MADKPYPSEALTDIAKQLLDDWGLTQEQIGNLAMDIAGEVESIQEARAEAYWENLYADMLESGGFDASKYRADLIAAGRGHLLR